MGGYFVEYNPNPQNNRFLEEIPEVIIQYGDSRTASTLQFHSLCAIMALLHPGQVECVTLEFGPIENQIHNRTYKVLKSHTFDYVKQLFWQRFWLFMSTATALNSSQFAQKMKVQPQYIQSMPL